MNHVINKMRQLGIGLGDFMALFRAWLEFSSAAVNLLGGNGQNSEQKCCKINL